MHLFKISICHIFLLSKHLITYTLKQADTFHPTDRFSLIQKKEKHTMSVSPFSFELIQLIIGLPKLGNPRNCNRKFILCIP
ncbi:hypothetical protein DET65_2759 [Sunxiuqinia elliptica]|uniref:Uncharacterized protein n=1 Tax=Sunxiuqinia elliptica TaxID=655355 RepID=A0A4R6H4W0_9BACT|nr:hypothetical protein DET52_103217 [Sunxiuqinia elliptica]TDO59470.1 hypothetical protein DET65_2759 [Sunxiuqinia elliptica]